MTRSLRSFPLPSGAPVVSICFGRGQPGRPAAGTLGRALWGVLLAVLLTGCAALPATPLKTPYPLPDARATPAVRWQPVDSLNALLPTAVRVFAAQREEPPLRAWYVRIDKASASVATRVVASDDTTDGRETVSSFARDLGACVVVNGGYFTMDEAPARPVGLLVINGELRAPSTNVVERDGVTYRTARAALGLTAGGRADVAWAESEADTLYAWPALPDHRPGQPENMLVQARFWPVEDAIGAGPMLLVDGRVHVTADEEVFFGTSIPEVHPRTAAGVTPDGALILMVVDGRQSQSRGVGLEELARLMQSAGAADALNLDGGGSSALVVRGVLLNRPAGAPTEREVASALAAFCE